MSVAEQLLDAMGDVGTDLVDMAEKVRFPKSFLRRTLPVAACMAVFLGAGLFLQNYLMGAPEAAEEAAAPSVQTAAETPAADRTPVEKAAEVPDFVHDLLRSEAETYYIVDIPDDQTRRVAAVDAQGNVLVEAENVEFITDRATGDDLAILATTEYGADSDWTSAERIVYDLQGQELCRINARSVQVCGDLAAVTYGADDVNLYLRDGTLLESGLIGAEARKDCMACWYGEEPYSRAYYGPDGTLLVNDTPDDAMRVFCGLTQSGETLLIRRENDLMGLVDLQGNWVVNPLFVDFRESVHGYLRCQDAAGDWFLVDDRTGEIVYKMASESDWVSAAYDGSMLIYEDSRSRVEDWYRNVIIPPADYIQVIDDDGDRVPELFQAWEGSDAVYYAPDGTERLRITDAGALVTLSSRAAVYTKTIQDDPTGEWIVDFAIIDLETGQGNREFAKAYQRAVELCVYPEDGPVKKTGLFYACYQGPDGTEKMDLLDENGNVILENLQVSERTGEPHIGGGVFLTTEGYQYADGRWLYRFAD